MKKTGLLRQRPICQAWTRLLACAAISVWAVTPTLVQAQLDDAQVSVGAGVRSEHNVYRGVGSDFEFLPLVSIDSERFSYFANKASLKIYEHDFFDLDLKGQYRFDGYKGSDSDFLNGMAARRGALEFGVEFDSTQWFGEFSLSLLTDLSRRHKGNEVSLTYGYPLNVAGGKVTPQVKLAWQSGRLANSYWGVRDNEARVDRPSYNPGAAINLEIGVSYKRQLAPRHTLLGKFSLWRPGSSIENSPLRDADEPYALTIGYLYTF